MNPNSYFPKTLLDVAKDSHNNIQNISKTMDEIDCNDSHNTVSIGDSKNYFSSSTSFTSSSISRGGEIEDEIYDRLQQHYGHIWLPFGKSEHRGVMPDTPPPR